MSANDNKLKQVETLLNMSDFAEALDSDHFRRFLDQVPIPIIVSDLTGVEHIVYANPEFEKVTGQTAAEVMDRPWNVLRGRTSSSDAPRELGVVITDANDFVGNFIIERPGQEPVNVDAYSNIIEDDHGRPTYRLAALIEVVPGELAERDELTQQLREKDTLLLEIQHRVKNNLQLITALIRIEARKARGRMDTAPFDRLAGRIDSIQLVYKLLSDHGSEDEIDLGVYLSEIASSVLRSHAVEGIRLDLKVDSYPVSVNVAMPTGLVVNELLINALKHAFVGRDGGAITLHSLSDGNGCRVTIADDGIGLPEGVEWPRQGKLAALIVQSLRQNAKAELRVESEPGHGMRAIIQFTRSAAAPVAPR